MDVRLIGLKPIESQVLSLLVRGYTPQEIAEELHISRNYVYFLMRELRLRFCVLSTLALLSCVVVEGIVQLDGTINTSGGHTDK